MMESLLPVIEVTEENLLSVLPAIKDAISGASFLAIDCELSGLGDRKKINYPEIDFRYQYMADIARAYAIVSLGVSCFTCKSISSLKLQKNEDADEQICSHDYLVQTFEFITLCSDDFTVESNAFKFLKRHGFDFNRLFEKGLQYYKGCDRKNEQVPNVRNVLSCILEHRKPIVVHNGLLDLIFIYQAFYADLPKKSEAFAADMYDMFPHGIYDTKYIAEFHKSLPATYLEYLHAKMQLQNAHRQASEKWHVRVTFPPYPADLPNIEWYPYSEILLYNARVNDDGMEVCEAFAYHGYCPKAEKCENSHNINKIVKHLQPKGVKKSSGKKYGGPKPGSLVQIIQQVARKEATGNEHSMDEFRPQKKKTRKHSEQFKITEDKTETLQTYQNQPEVSAANGKDAISNGKRGSHGAGYDAFMTGFIFASCIAEKGTLSSKNDYNTPENLGLSDVNNKIYLVGKNFPFLIRNSIYANMSTNHMSKIAQIRKNLPVGDK